MKHFEKFNFKKANTYIRKKDKESNFNEKEELVRPLLPKKSQDITYRPSKLVNCFTKILYKSELQQSKDSNSFYDSFNNLTIKEHLKQSKNESSNNTNNTNIKSLLVYFIIFILSMSQLFLYRTSLEFLEINFSGILPRSNDFMKEWVFYSWRLQIILLILTLYFVICNLFSRNSKKEELFITKENFKFNTLEPKNSTVYSDKFLNMNFNDFFTFTNLRLGFYNLVSSGLLYYSSKYLPFGFVILINNCNLLLNFLFSNNVKNFKFFVIFLLLIGFTLILTNLISEGSIFGLLLVGLSLGTNIFFTQPLQKSCLEKNSPGNFLYILYFFSFIFSAFLVGILQLIVNDDSKFYLFNWLTNYKVTLIMFLMIGVPNFFYLMSNIVLSVRSYPLYYLKFIEVPIVDLLCLALSIKLSLLNFVYFTGIAQVLLCMLLVEYISLNGLKLKINKN
jgi:hypothetical protein